MITVLKGSEAHEHGDLMDAVFRLRYENFVVRRRWPLPCRDGRDIDQYDHAEAAYLIVLDDEDGAILGSARINHTPHSSLLADLFPHLIETGEAPRGPTLFEGTRFALSPALRSKAAIRRVRSELGCTAAEWVLAQGGTQIQAVVDYSAFAAFVDMSMRTRPMGLAQDYGGGSKVNGGGRCIAFRWDLTPDLIKDFRSYGLARARTDLPEAVH